tara:strand:+ start:3389 stop:3865 length:477 start_codon:yes stop_codon:yes gene_type:complete
MGAGILPITFYKGKIYFLFGRETLGIWKDSGLWSDFGGAKDGKETYKETAIREGWEESDGVLGNKSIIRDLIENNTIDTITYRGYKTYIILIDYNKKMIYDFRERFKKIKKKHPDRIAKNGLYEKDRIKWFEYNEVKKNIEKFRPYYRGIIKHLLKKF